VKDLRRLNQVAEELEEKSYKIASYQLMGECYNTLKDFKMALKCHKKQLEISWQCNDVKEEL